MKRLLCLGDSNTYGSAPKILADGTKRYGTQDRWPGFLQTLLGSNWTVIEEGLSGRTTIFDDPAEGGGKSALATIPTILTENPDLDLIFVMLGTNDLKAKFDQSAEQISDNIDSILDTLTARSDASILLVSPPSIKEIGPYQIVFSGGSAKSKKLSTLFRERAEKYRAGFVDAGRHITVSEDDGIHLDASAHKVLAQVFYEFIKP